MHPPNALPCCLGSVLLGRSKRSKWQKGGAPPWAWMDGEQLRRFSIKYELSVRCGEQRGDQSCAATTVNTALRLCQTTWRGGAAHEGMKGHRLCEEEPQAKRKKPSISLKLGDTSMQVCLNGFYVTLTFHLQPDIALSKLNFTSTIFKHCIKK